MRGRLRLWQRARGYRFAIDPLLLIDAVRAARIERACDLGTGSGVIALGLALAHPRARVTAVELQPSLVELARRNARENGLDDRVTVVACDLADPRATKRLLPGASFDWVLSNPPYQPIGSGAQQRDEEAAIARHELRLTLAALVSETRRLLRPLGTAALIYPAPRLVELTSELARNQLQPIRIRLIHARADEPANRVIVTARKGGGAALELAPPLVLYDESGGYTDEARRALGESG